MRFILAQLLDRCILKRKMNVWLLRIGEVLPIDEGEPRLLRMGLIAEEFHKSGAEITWFCSTFDHNLKKYRFEEKKEVNVKEGYMINLLHGRNYSKNLSIARILHYYDERRQFEKIAAKKPKPDVILAAMPNIDLAFVAVKYGKKIMCLYS